MSGSASEVLAAIERCKAAIREVQGASAPDDLDALKGVCLRQAVAIDELHKAFIVTSRPRFNSEAQSSAFERAYAAAPKRVITGSNAFISDNFIPARTSARQVGTDHLPYGAPVTADTDPSWPQVPHVSAHSSSGTIVDLESALNGKLAGGGFGEMLKAQYRAARGE